MLEAATLSEATSRLNERPDWILLDLMLPDGCGLDVLRNAPAQVSPTQVCVISGCGPAMLEEASSLGAAHIFRKPVDVPRLISVLTAAVSCTPGRCQAL